VLQDDGINFWQFHVDWETLSKTTVTGPTKIAVAPYHYLCGGQLTNCVPQPGTDRKLDAQGDQIMQGLVYRNLGDHEAIVALHSVDTAGGGGVRWYEFRLNARRNPVLLSAEHVRARRLVPLDGQPGDGSGRQHRDRLFVRRRTQFPRAAIRGATGRRPARTAHAARDIACRGPGFAG
jgi:hypothetical protein